MKPAWLVAGRSINQAEHRWRIRNDVWGIDQPPPRMPIFRNRFAVADRNGEWRTRPLARPKSKRFARFLEQSRGDTLPF